MIFGEFSACSGGGCEGTCLPAEVEKAHGADLAEPGRQPVGTAGAVAVAQLARASGQLSTKGRRLLDRAGMRPCDKAAPARMTRPPTGSYQLTGSPRNAAPTITAKMGVR
jgi:hypothetical protein